MSSSDENISYSSSNSIHQIKEKKYESNKKVPKIVIDNEEILHSINSKKPANKKNKKTANLYYLNPIANSTNKDENPKLKKEEKLIKEKLMETINRSIENSDEFNYLSHASMNLEKKNSKYLETEQIKSNARRVISCLNVIKNIKRSSDESIKLKEISGEKKISNNTALHEKNNFLDILHNNKEEDLNVSQKNSFSSRGAILRRKSTKTVLIPDNYVFFPLSKETISFNDNKSFKRMKTNRSFNNYLKKDEFSDMYNSNFHLTDNNRFLRKIERIRDNSFQGDIDIIQEDSYLIHPESFIKEIWDVIILIFLIYALTVNPILLAFDKVNSTILNKVNLSMDVFFIFDIILNFFVGYFDLEENLIMNRKMIISHYLSHTFFPDFLSGIPFDLMLFFMSSTDSTSLKKTEPIKILNLTKLLRILRISSIFKMINILKFVINGVLNRRITFFDDFTVNTTITRIIKFSFYFFLFTHISTCIWIFLSRLNYENWVISSGCQDLSDFELYVTSLYFNLTTILTIGYGDILSKSIYERIYNIFLMIVGIFLYSYTITTLSQILAYKDPKTISYYAFLNTLEEIKEAYDIKQDLYERIKKYFKYDYKVNRIDKNIVVNMLPTNLKNNLTLQIYRNALEHLKFFSKTSKEFKMKAVLKLKKTRFNKGEYLVKENDVVDEIYFVMKGTLKLEKETENGKIQICELNEYEHFGDVYMNMNIKSPIDLKVKSSSAEVYIMSKADFTALSEDFPHIIMSIIKRGLIKTTKLELRLRSRYKQLIDVNSSNLNNKEINSDQDINTDNGSNRSNQGSELVNDNKDNKNKTFLSEIREEDEVSGKNSEDDISQTVFSNSLIPINIPNNSNLDTEKNRVPSNSKIRRFSLLSDSIIMGKSIDILNLTMKKNISSKRERRMSLNCSMMNSNINSDFYDTNINPKHPTDEKIRRRSMFGRDNNRSCSSGRNKSILKLNQTIKSNHNKNSNRMSSCLSDKTNQDKKINSKKLLNDSSTIITNSPGDSKERRRKGKTLNLNKNEKSLITNNFPLLNFNDPDMDSKEKLDKSLQFQRRTKKKSFLVYNNIINTIKANATIFKNPANFIDNNFNVLLEKAIDLSEDKINDKLDNMIETLNLIVNKKENRKINNKFK
jgi:CRP-like cAMP-binding protein